MQHIPRDNKRLPVYGVKCLALQAPDTGEYPAHLLFHSTLVFQNNTMNIKIIFVALDDTARWAVTCGAGVLQTGEG